MSAPCARLASHPHHRIGDLEKHQLCIGRDTVPHHRIGDLEMTKMAF